MSRAYGTMTHRRGQQTPERWRLLLGSRVELDTLMNATEVREFRRLFPANQGRRDIPLMRLTYCFKYLAPDVHCGRRLDHPGDCSLVTARSPA